MNSHSKLRLGAEEAPLTSLTGTSGFEVVTTKADRKLMNSSEGIHNTTAVGVSHGFHYLISKKERRQVNDESTDIDAIGENGEFPLFVRVETCTDIENPCSKNKPLSDKNTLLLSAKIFQTKLRGRERSVILEAPKLDEHCILAKIADLGFFLQFKEIEEHCKRVCGLLNILNRNTVDLIFCGFEFLQCPEIVEKLRRVILGEPKRVFENLIDEDVISWTSMITGYMRVGKPRGSIEVYLRMLEFGVEPNAFTLSAVIKACSDIGDLKLGRCFHGVVLGRGFDCNEVIASALIDMYGRNFDIEEPRLLMRCPSQTLFVGLRLFRDYRLVADEFTFGTILTACGNLGRAKQGKQVHGKVVMSGIGANVVVESSIVDMYGKCDLVTDSRGVFDRMLKKNAISWCALLGSYCQNGEFKAVLEIFRKMEKESDMYSFGTVLRACAGLAAVRQGKEVHCQYLRRGGWRDVIVESALVDFYAKCSVIDYAQRLFAEVRVRNVITWNSMICGFAQNGRGEKKLL
ncbi:hypothetical protein GIB67_035498 [Kingdonia uniflora]|uniref:Pentatricopeptide repeat-containing protein n=1 Tax=Kingdonia uniflora TaxID=39325 RepID=A0A7J7P178_9MAGN|nr:hypothetical protein GIB67_035498 [Kingdonia uniflora]